MQCEREKRRRELKERGGCGRGVGIEKREGRGRGVGSREGRGKWCFLPRSFAFLDLRLKGGERKDIWANYIKEEYNKSRRNNLFALSPISGKNTLLNPFGGFLI
jgi:hypothetical protein